MTRDFSLNLVCSYFFPFSFFKRGIESWIFFIVTTFSLGIWKFGRDKVYFIESTLTVRQNENKLKSSSSALYTNLDKGNYPETLCTN